MAEQPEGTSEKGRKLRILLLALSGLVLILGSGAAGAWFFGLLGSSETREVAGAAEAKEATEPMEDNHAADDKLRDQGQASLVSTVAFLELPNLLVNLQSSGPRMRYLKLALALELANPSEVETLRALTPRILDAIQLYLRALTVDDVQGAIGMERLKQELTARINRAVAPLRVRGVLVKEMLVQ